MPSKQDGKVRVALVGCGRVSSRHLDAWTNHVQNASVVAVCDVVPARAAAAAEQLGVPHFASAADMYKAVDIDLVDIATPSGDHYERTMEAFSFGKNVVVEKPMALRLEHADEMIADADRRGLKLWVAFQNRYNPAVLKAREAVESGRLGKLVLGTVRVRWFRDQSYYDADDWHGTWAMDGGVASQQAIHHIDALRWMLGEVESVEATCATALARMECEDLCVATLKFKSGALGAIEATTAARPRDIEASLSLLGEKGTIVLGGIAMNKIDTWEFADAMPEDAEVPGKYFQDVPNGYGFGHNVLFQRVASSIAEGAPVEIPGEEGRKGPELLHAIYRSNETGRRVLLAERPRSSRLGVGAPRTAKGRRQVQTDAITAIEAIVSNKLDPRLRDGLPFAGIIGETPSVNAKSPKIWNHTFGVLGVDAVYVPFDVTRERLEQLVAALRRCPTFLGGNVTMPHKIAVIEHLDELDPRARSIGAVNTIERTADGRLIGYNTDGKGAIDALTRSADGDEPPFMDGLAGRNVLLVGAGGAARAVAFFVAEEIGPGALTIVNRSEANAVALARDVSSVHGNARAAPFDRAGEIARGADLVINCSVTGQAGLRAVPGGKVVTLEPYSALTAADPVPVQAAARAEDAYRACVGASAGNIAENNARSLEAMLAAPVATRVFDIVYAPLATVFLQHAKFTGHSVMNGKAMNIAQAAEGMFNVVMKRYFEEAKAHDESTYRRIRGAMSQAWS